MPCSRVQVIDIAAFVVDPRASAWGDFREHYPGCLECSREVARFATLKGALAHEGAGGSAHPSDWQLLALAASASDLTRAERDSLETHLAGCARCRTELAVLRDFEF